MPLTFTDKLLVPTFVKLIPRVVSPNQVTLFRFASIPFVIGLLLYGLYPYALALFAISAFSDALDGALARSRGQVTEWGKLYDPLADKLLVGSVAIMLVSKYLSPYLTFAIILSEILLIANAYYRKKMRHIVIEAHVSGKIKMILQSVSLILLFIYTIVPLSSLLVVSTIMFSLALVFAIISLFIYRSI